MGVVITMKPISSSLRLFLLGLWLLHLSHAALSDDPFILRRFRETRSRIERRASEKDVWEEASLQISLETARPISIVDPQFLSVTIDAGDIGRDWAGITFTAQRIVNMARALLPAMLRVGGTSEDYIVFNASSGRPGEL